MIAFDIHHGVDFVGGDVPIIEEPFSLVEFELKESPGCSLRISD